MSNENYNIIQLPEVQGVGRAAFIQNMLDQNTLGERTFIEKKNMDPTTAALIAGSIRKFRQDKVDKALSGEKEFSRPQTIFGKLIGGVSGRTAAAAATAQTKLAPLTSNVVNSLQPNDRQRTPITGGISFGGEAIKRSYLPFYLGAIVLGIFFFMRRKGGRRRR